MTGTCSSARARAAVQPQPRPVPLPLVLGLFRRADDEPRPALARHRRLVPRAHWLKSVASFGGRFALADNGETPDTQDAVFDFPGFTAIWSHREAAQGEPTGPGLVFYGTKGSLSISRSGYVVTPDRVIRPENAVPQFTEAAQPVGGVARGRRSPWRTSSGPPPSATAAATRSTSSAATSATSSTASKRASSRSPTWPAASASPRSATSPTSSLRLGRPLQWDARQETIRGDTEAAALLERALPRPVGRGVRGADSLELAGFSGCRNTTLARAARRVSVSATKTRPPRLVNIGTLFALQFRLRSRLPFWQAPDATRSAAGDREGASRADANGADANREAAATCVQRDCRMCPLTRIRAASNTHKHA